MISETKKIKIVFITLVRIIVILRTKDARDLILVLEMKFYYIGYKMSNYD